MKKIVFSFLFLFCVSISVIAQDLIFKRNGEEIKAKVKAISTTEIEYTAADVADGPVTKISKSEVVLILYANGTKEIFATETPAPAQTQNNGKKGRTTPSTAVRPQQRYYNYDFFDKKVPMTYLGIDFSYCKLFGDKFEDPKTFFSQLNALLMEEKGKYDMNGAVRRSDLPYQYSIVEKRNAAIEEKALTEKVGETITFSDLQNIVDEYDLAAAGITDGLALVLICDNMSAPRVDAAYYYVIFDVASKKVVISDRIVGRAGGNGQRNYWARSIYETITIVRDKKFIQWKMMFRK